MLQSNVKCPLLSRLKDKLKSYRFIYYPVHYILVLLRRIKYCLRWYTYKLFTRFNRNGLNTTEHRPRKIIASLTSYSARIHIVPYIIASILKQAIKPDKIILWLGREKFPDEKLPKIFDKLKACGVEIKFREDIGPHTKYFYAMQEYPEDIIITFDDDTIYRDFIIEKLYKAYAEHPSCVAAMRSRRITFNQDGTVANYKNFGFDRNSPAGVETFSYLPEGIKFFYLLYIKIYYNI